VAVVSPRGARGTIAQVRDVIDPTLAVWESLPPGEPTPTPESRRVEWMTLDKVHEHMTPAIAVRIVDGLGGR
jgi:hypothetical protein